MTKDQNPVELGRKSALARRRFDIIGRKFNRLHVIAFSGIIGDSAHFSCKCECGNTKDVKGTQIINGAIKSCGCLKAESNAARNGSEAYRKLFSTQKKSDPKYQAQTNHMSAKWWRLRDPQNRVFEFKNLNQFIRDNPHMFDPKDIVWSGTSKRCNAGAGIQRLSPFCKHTIGTWKGWTWFSQTERIKNDGDDLLSRGGTDK